MIDQNNIGPDEVYAMFELASHCYSDYCRLYRQIEKAQNAVYTLFRFLCEDAGLSDKIERLLDRLRFLIQRTNRIITLAWVKSIFKSSEELQPLLNDFIKVFRLYWSLRQSEPSYSIDLDRDQAIKIFGNQLELPDQVIIYPFRPVVIRFLTNGKFLFDIDILDYNKAFYSKINQSMFTRERFTMFRDFFTPIYEELAAYLKEITEYNEPILKEIENTVRPYRLARSLAS
jgi:hypothetical protein